MKSIIPLTISTFMAAVILTVASGTFDILNMQSLQLLPNVKVSLNDSAKTEQITIGDVDPREDPTDPCSGARPWLPDNGFYDDPSCYGD